MSALVSQLQVPQAGPPAVDSTSTAQKPSHAVVQHSAFFAQTHFSTLASAQPGAALSPQQLPLQVPQPRPPTSATQASFQSFSQQYLPPAMAQTHFSTAGSLHPPPACAEQHGSLLPDTALLAPAPVPASGAVDPPVPRPAALAPPVDPPTVTDPPALVEAEPPVPTALPPLAALPPPAALPAAPPSSFIVEAVPAPSDPQPTLSESARAQRQQESASIFCVHMF
jgi:hypothetical protein